MANPERDYPVKIMTRITYYNSERKTSEKIFLEFSKLFGADALIATTDIVNGIPRTVIILGDDNITSYLLLKFYGKKEFTIQNV
jgi:hypothetical protein